MSRRGVDVKDLLKRELSSRYLIDLESPTHFFTLETHFLRSQVLDFLTSRFHNTYKNTAKNEQAKEGHERKSNSVEGLMSSRISDLVDES